MIATWMVYATLAAAAVGIAARFLEHGARALGLQTRWIWAGAMVASIAGPLAVLVGASTGSLATEAHTTLAPVSAAALSAPPSPATMDAPLTPAQSRFTAAETLIRSAWRRSDIALERADAPLALLWLLLSIALLTRLAVAARGVARAPRAWTEDVVDGSPVLVSSDTGPAVIGLGALHIVLPRWALSLDKAARSLILRHEEEHRRARDPYLLAGSRICLALVPWNPVLWWQAHRLELAIETDCDARVARAAGAPHAYAALLLDVAEFHARRAPMMALGLIESRSKLERRISLMTASAPRFPRLVSALVAAAAASVIGVACMTPPPDVVAPRGPYLASQVDVPVRPASGNRAPSYPGSLRTANVQGSVLARFVVAPDGRPDVSSFTAANSAHPLFTAAVKDWLPSARFLPAVRGSSTVAQVVEMPFVFSLGRTSPSGGASSASREPAAPARSGGGDTTATRSQPPSVPQAVLQARVYADSQVDQTVRPAPGNRPPQYPGSLRAAGISGSAMIQFVVDTAGRALMSTFVEVESTHALFTAAVRDHLPSMRFVPAQLDGRPVHQLVKMPFVFTLGR